MQVYLTASIPLRTGVWLFHIARRWVCFLVVYHCYQWDTKEGERKEKTANFIKQQIQLLSEDSESKAFPCFVNGWQFCVTTMKRPLYMRQPQGSPPKHTHTLSRWTYGWPYVRLSFSSLHNHVSQIQPITYLPTSWPTPLVNKTLIWTRNLNLPYFCLVYITSSFHRLTWVYQFLCGNTEDH